MKKSSIVANLVVSCIFLAISLVFLISSPCFGIIFFAIALVFTIIYTVKLSNYNKQENYYQNQMQGNYNSALEMNQNYQSPKPEKGNAVFIFITILCCVSFSCCLFNNLTIKKYIDKSKETSLQYEQKIEEKKKAEEEKEAAFAKKLESYQNLKVGNSVTANGLKITVNSITESQYNSETAYTVNITYKNNTDEKMTISPYDWKAIMGDDLEAHYADKGNDFNTQYLQKNEEFTDNIIFYKERRGKTANKIKCDISDYERDMYATWLIPDEVSSSVEMTTAQTTTIETTTVTTTETTTVTEITTAKATEPPTETTIKVSSDEIIALLKSILDEQTFEYSIDYYEETNVYSVCIWQDGLGAEMALGIFDVSKLEEPLIAMSKSMSEVVHTLDPDVWGVVLNVVDDRDEDSLLIGAAEGEIYFSLDGLN